MKKLYLIFHGRFPSEKAASLFAAKSCEALADNNFEVILLVPRRFHRRSNNYSEYYKIKNNFKVVYLPTIDLFPFHIFYRLSFYISYFVFSFATFIYLFFRADNKDIVYSNEALPLLFCSFTFSKCYYEVHDFPEKKLFIYKILFKNLKGIIVTNKWKLAKIKDIFNLPTKKLLYEPNAVDIDEIDIDMDKVEVREKLNLDQNFYYAVYTGHLYDWKGVDTMADAVEYLPDNFKLVFVGGTKPDIENFKNKYGKNKKIIIAGFVEHALIPYWQKAADVLVLPNTSKHDISKYYTSPMKLFEYMSSRRPIIASNVPSITELLNLDNAYLFEADNAEDLAKAIKFAVENKDKGEVLVKRAWLDIHKYTWKKRAKRILNFIDNE